MAREDRHNRLRLWLLQPGGIGRQRALRELEISESTLKRDIAFLRDRYGMPARYRADRDAWVLEAPPDGGPRAIPQLWLTDREALALLTMQQLLAQLDAGGLLREHIGPLRVRLTAMLAAGGSHPDEVTRRVRVLPMAARKAQLRHFPLISDATLRRHRLAVTYHARGTDRRSARELSPQRLVHYRDNWYLDAWCHQTDRLKTFSLDAIETARMLKAHALELPENYLDQELASSYGIFAGPAQHMARLRFSARSARWVAAETWHPAQLGRFDAQGRWLLDVPYADPTELVMDILRHVPEVEVLAPEELEAEVLRRLHAGVQRASSLDE